MLSKSCPGSSGSNLKDKWVLNLSSKELSELKRRGLEKGLKFAIAPSKIPNAEIIASVEQGIFRLHDDKKHLIYKALLIFLGGGFARLNALLTL